MQALVTSMQFHGCEDYTDYLCTAEEPVLKEEFMQKVAISYVSFVKGEEVGVDEVAVGGRP